MLISPILNPAFFAVPMERPEFWLLLTTTVTSCGALVAQLLKNKADTARANKEIEMKRLRYEAEKQERDDHRIQIKEELELSQLKIKSELELAQLKQAKKTRQIKKAVQDSITKTEQFAEAANNVNNKFSILAQVALEKAGKIDQTTVETNETVHRLEDAVKTETDNGYC